MKKICQKLDIMRKLDKTIIGHFALFRSLNTVQVSILQMLIITRQNNDIQE